MKWIKVLAISVLILWISISTQISTESKLMEKRHCPLDCQCSIFNISQTLISRWEKHDQRQIEVAMCVGSSNTEQQILNHLPKEVGMLTFIQAPDGPLTVLEEHNLQKLKALESIEVQGFHQSLRITQTSFRELPSLRYLFLQEVDFTGAETSLAKLGKLVALHIACCNIAHVKWEMFDGLESLEDLSLTQNGIKQLYDFAFYGAPELRRLDLSHNQLFAIEADSLNGLKKLENLDLSNNRIDHISSMTFPPLAKLERLDLKHNPITVVFPHTFQFLIGVNHLTLGHKSQDVQVTKFSFRGLWNLVSLHIPNINSTLLKENTFYDLQSLEHLSLRGHIKSIDHRAFIGPHKSLKTLTLHHCQLKRIMEEAFEGLSKLTSLDLSSNQLKYLNNEILKPLHSMKELLLDNNQFTTLPSKIFQHLTELKAIRLHANPWDCTCNMMLWDEAIISTRPKTKSCNSKHHHQHCEDISSSDQLNFVPKCHTPSIYTDQNVFHVLEASLKCEKHI